MQKEWSLPEFVAEDSYQILKEELKVSTPIAKLLWRKNIRDYDTARKFFAPVWEDLLDPFLMHDMERATNSIQQHIALNHKIMIYGDYDVDGTTSVALMHLFFQQFYPNTINYVPDRYAEGYGLSEKGIRIAAQENCKLIIALDCGIKANDKAELAKDLGLELIICDHHLPGDTLPDATAILDPKKKECSYPFKELSGCGVGFKLCQALCAVLDLPDDYYKNLIDLVALSIAADIVPIVEENRTLAFLGLQKINLNPLMGIKTIIDINIKKKDISINDLVFVISPRINAAGRIKHAIEAVNLLINIDEKHSKELCTQINLHNDTRKEFDKKAFEEALAQIENDESSKYTKSTVVFGEDWNKGVVGIVASRIIEQYYKPTIVLTQSGDLISGSARSVEGFDLYEAISACSHHLLQYGGHKAAAGLTMSPENLNAFIENFESVVSKTIQNYSLQPTVFIDDIISFKEISPAMYKVLLRFEPCGNGNMHPVFLTKKVRLKHINYPKEVHLKLVLEEIGTGTQFTGMFFNAALHYKLNNIDEYDVCYSIVTNTYYNETTLQLMIKDIKPHHENA